MVAVPPRAGGSCCGLAGQLGRDAHPDVDLAMGIGTIHQANDLKKLNRDGSTRHDGKSYDTAVERFWRGMSYPWLSGPYGSWN